MKRVSLIGCLAVSGLVLAALPAHGQTEAESESVQRIDALVRTNQGVLLPLDGALDPGLSSVLLLPPPEDSSDEPGLQVSDSEVMIMEDGSEPSLPPTEDEVAAAEAEDANAADTLVEEAVAVEEQAAADEMAVAEPAPEAVVETADEAEAAVADSVAADALDEMDAMAEIATAELGNPTSIGPWRLWLASYRTVREAQDGWAQLARDNRDVLGDLSPVIVMKELGGDSGTFFRLQAGPLADEPAAKRRCDNLKARNFYCAILGPQDG